MDLTNLRDILDSSSRETHPASTSAKRSELRLTRDFKAAALQLTTLYRTSLSSAKRSYASGYSQSLQDTLDVVLLRLQQSSTIAPGEHTHLRSQRQQQDFNREELIWLVRYLRARIEAIKAESEDEEERESDDEEEELQQSRADDKAHQEHTSLTGAGDIAGSEDDCALAVGENAEATMYDSSNARDVPALTPVEDVSSLPSAAFTFSPPSTSSAVFPAQSLTTRTNQSLSRRRVKTRGGSPHGSNGLMTSLPANGPPSVSSEEDTSLPTNQAPLTPSKRLSARLGKRTSGRDLFGKALSTKRRRGDRRDDERRDGGLP